MVYLFAHWKRKQTRHRTINAVQMAVHEFRDVHGSPTVAAITRQQAVTDRPNGATHDRP
jgi:hypothetical protein